MIVVSDTSVVSGLLQTNHLDLLQQLYQRVTLPPTVWHELQVLDESLRNALIQPWITIQAPANQSFVHELEMLLDAGEAEAIALAKELNADVLLIDEKRGRMVAGRLGIPITGLLGILLEVKRQQYISAVRPVITQLRDDAGVWFHTTLIDDVLTRAGER